MQWSKPDFQEITLGMEVTAYVNTDGDSRKPEEPPKKMDAPSAAAPVTAVPREDAV
jgi:coenzyme PQQ precursor peptide PqqA